MLSLGHHALIIYRLAVVDIEAARPYLARDWHDERAAFVLLKSGASVAHIEVHRLVVVVREC